jgi:putative peptidoglycan lipid II flippase
MRGEFTRGDVLMTAPVLGWLMLGAVAFATQTVVNRGFYALQNTLLPAVYGTLAVMASIPLYWAGLHWMGVDGVGLAVSLSALVQVALLYAIWNRRSRNAGSRAVYRFFGKMVLLCLPLGIALWGLHWGIAARLAADTFPGALLTAVLVGLAFLLLLLILGHGLRIREITRLLERLPLRLRRRN